MIAYFAAQAIRVKFIVGVRGDLRGGTFLSENHKRRVDGDAC